MPTDPPIGLHPKTSFLLPSEVSAQSSLLFGRAKNYPIFSWEWYRYRSIGMLLMIVLFVFVPGVFLSYFTPSNVGNSIVSTFVFCIFTLLILSFIFLGPLLATWINQENWNKKKETVAIVIALLSGPGVLWLGYCYVVSFEKPYLYENVMIYRKLPRILSVMSLQPAAMVGISVEKLPVVNGNRQTPEKFEEAVFLATSDAGKEDWICLPENCEVMEKGIRSDSTRTMMIYKKNGKQSKVLNGSREEFDRRLADLQSESPNEKVEGKFIKITFESKAVYDVKNAALISYYSKIFLVSITAFFLAWLCGWVDFFTFLRQRNKLTHYQQQQELRRTQAARAEAELRLSVLAAQVEPHFLFNTMASVRSAIVSDQGRATAIVDHLVSYLRATIPQMRRDVGVSTVTLGSQLEACRAYLALMHARIARLAFTVTADPALDNARVPPLMLISLLENAVKHGIEPKLGDAHIEVTAQRSTDVHGEQLILTVRDNGVGFGDATAGGGIGLANIQERISSLYGVRASLSLKALPEGGVAATLQLPLQF